MKFITDNRIRTILEKKTDKGIVSIERPIFTKPLKAHNGDLMVLVYETPEEFFAPLPTQAQAFELPQVTNEILYALMKKANSDWNINIDNYLLFSTNKEWLGHYLQMFDYESRVEIVEIDDFAKIADAVANGDVYNPYESQKGE